MCCFFLAVLNTAAMNVCVQVFIWICFHFSWSYLLSIYPILLVLTFRSLIHFCMSYTLGPVSFFSVWTSRHHLLKRLMSGLDTRQKQLTISVRVYFWTYNFIPFSMSVLTPVPHCLDSFVVSFEFKMYGSSNLVLLPDHFSYSGSLKSHTNFRINSLILTNTWDFDSDCGESIDQFEECCYFNSIKFFQPWTWSVCPFVWASSFFQWCFIDFSV